MLTVHHLGVSQSDRIVWLCEELAIPYILKRYERDPLYAPADYKALSPAGTAPVITDGDVVLGESGAIIEYIITKYGGRRLSVAPDHPEYPNYLFWYHFANGSMMPSLMGELILKMAAGDGPPLEVPFIRERIDKGYALIEERLCQVPYFAGGEFTAADIIMLFPLTTMRHFSERDLTSYPAIRGYLQRISERPAFKVAMQKADPDLVIPMS